MQQIEFLLRDFFYERQRFFIIFTEDSNFHAPIFHEFSWKVSFTPLCWHGAKMVINGTTLSEEKGLKWR